MKVHTVIGIRGIKMMSCGTTQTNAAGVATPSTHTLSHTAGCKQASSTHRCHNIAISPQYEVLDEAFNLLP